MILRRPISRALPALMSWLAALSLLPSIAGCTLELDYDKYAVVYGISDYPGTDSDLSYCDDDALAMESLFIEQGYPSSNIYLEIDDKATRANLVADFSAVASKANEDDLFIFYYSGHGGQRPEDPQEGSEDTYGSDSLGEWIFLHDSLQYTAPDEYTENLSEAISDDELAALLRTIPCVRRIVILDACNSGGFIGNVLEKDGIPPDYSSGSDGIFTNLSNAIYLYTNFDGNESDIAPEDALVIATSGEREVSYDVGFYEHGLLTYYLLKSATKGDLNRDGYVTVSESYFYIYKSINANWNNTWSAAANDVFFPHVSGGPIDYILFTR
jgi:uncharacterized caspase-like protein